MAKRRVAVFAFGTRGDVLPLAAVTAALAAAHPATRITFVTHAAHRNMEPHLARSGIKFVAISTPPVVPRRGVDEDLKASLEAELREECVAAMEVAFGSEEDGGCVLINLFALEGWHLAELFRVPCAVLSPYVVPYSAPSSFERRFRLTHPLLYRRLREAGEGEVGWAEVMHWMWPLFTDRWAEWRTRRLRLSACPLTDPVTGLPLLHEWPKASPLLYGFSLQVVECPAYWPKSITVCGFWYAPLDWETHDISSESVPINSSETGQEVSLNPVSTHSPSLTSPSGLKSLIDIGPDTTSQNSHLGVSTNYKPPVKLCRFLSDKKLGEGSDTRPIFIGLSSMGSMGFLERPGSMLKVLEAALEATNSTAILLTAGHAPLDLAVTELCDEKLCLDFGYQNWCLDVGNEKPCLDVGNEKLSLDVGNENLGNKKVLLNVGNEKPCRDVGNEKLCLDVGNENLGNKKLRLDVGNEKSCPDISNGKLGPDVGNGKPRPDIGNEKLCLDVENEKLRLDVGDKKPHLDVVSEKISLVVGNQKSCPDAGNRDPCLDIGSRLHEGLTCLNGRLFCYSGSIPHLWLLPQCSVALHHGGSGTTAACLRAGLPQIICPFVLDQFYWAERMAWLGVAPQPLRPEHLMPEEAGRFAEAVEAVAGAVREARSGEVRGRAGWLGEKVGGEDGVAAAVGVLRSALSGM